VAFALRTVLKGRTRGDGQSKSFIKFSNKVCRSGHRAKRDRCCCGLSSTARSNHLNNRRRG